MTAADTKGTILLLDDDNFILTMYSAAFAQSGFQVQAILSPNEALQLLRDGFVADAILFDIRMPEIDGFAFLDALRREQLGGKAVKVALTNQSSEVEKAHAMELGADQYLVKATVIPSEVVNIIAEALAFKNAA
jgi:CheY-like chemotaxis protein